MNIFNLLKNTRGAIKARNALLIAGAAGAVFAYTVNNEAQKQIQVERQTRSISNIASTAPQAGLHRHSGALTSINVSGGNTPFATPEERAAFEGGALARYEANQRALGGLDASVGRAAQFGESDGLNTENHDVNFAPVALETGNPNVPFTRSAPGGQTPDGSGAGGSAGFTPVAPPHTSGSSFSGTGGIVASGGGSAARAEGPRLSGTMPGGNNFVSQHGLDGALAGGRGTASFDHNRRGGFTRGQNGKGDRNELKDILKRSAEADRNAHASANEGGRAFLANSQNSGGVTVDGAGETESSGSSPDLADPSGHKMRAIGNRLDNQQELLEERDAEQNALIWQLLATVVGSIAAMFALSCMVGLKNSKPLIYWIIAGAITAVVTGFNAWLFGRAVKFIDRFGSLGGTAIAKIALIMSPLMVAGVVYTMIKPEAWSGLLKNIGAKLKAAFEPVGLVTSQLTGAITQAFSEKK